MKRKSNCFVSLFLLSWIGLVTSPLWAANHSESGITADQALQWLQEGNERFADGKRTFPHQDSARLQEMIQGQHPFVTVISCSDSRVPTEQLFDAGIGDIFSIRVAGNVCDTDEIGSIEYGVDHLSTPLLVVLGHTHCGAITAVVQKDEVHGSIPDLVDNIVPAVEKVQRLHPNLKGEALIAESVESNIWQAIEDLVTRSEATRERLVAGKLRIVGAIYHLENGKVEWLGSHPQEKQIMAGIEPSASQPGFIHNVYFYLNENATKAQIKQLIEDCKNLLGSVKTVRKIMVGIPAGTPREVVDNSFGVNLVVYFDDKEGHDYYQTAEKHLQFIERNQATWKRVQIYDTLPE